MSINIDKSVNRTYLKDQLRHFEKYVLWDLEERDGTDVLIPKYYKLTNWKAKTKYWIGECVIYNDSVYEVVKDVDDQQTSFPTNSMKLIGGKNHFVYIKELEIDSTTTSWNMLAPSRVGQVYLLKTPEDKPIKIGGENFKSKDFIMVMNDVDLDPTTGDPTGDVEVNKFGEDSGMVAIEDEETGIIEFQQDAGAVGGNFHLFSIKKNTVTNALAYYDGVSIVSDPNAWGKRVIASAKANKEMPLIKMGFFVGDEAVRSYNFIQSYNESNKVAFVGTQTEYLSGNSTVEISDMTMLFNDDGSYNLVQSHANKQKVHSFSIANVNSDNPSLYNEDTMITNAISWTLDIANAVKTPDTIVTVTAYEGEDRLTSKKTTFYFSNWVDGMNSPMMFMALEGVLHEDDKTSYRPKTLTINYYGTWKIQDPITPQIDLDNLLMVKSYKIKPVPSGGLAVDTSISFSADCAIEGYRTLAVINAYSNIADWTTSAASSNAQHKVSAFLSPDKTQFLGTLEHTYSQTSTVVTTSDVIDVYVEVLYLKEVV